MSEYEFRSQLVRLAIDTLIHELHKSPSDIVVSELEDLPTPLTGWTGHQLADYFSPQAKQDTRVLLRGQYGD
jgi:hypothetical protein